jgi:hypothetical protein
VGRPEEPGGAGIWVSDMCAGKRDEQGTSAGNIADGGDGVPARMGSCRWGEGGHNGGRSGVEAAGM